MTTRRGILAVAISAFALLACLSGCIYSVAPVARDAEATGDAAAPSDAESDAPDG